MRVPLIAGNWKMFKTSSEAVALVEDLIPLVSGIEDVEIAVCPPFTALAGVGSLLKSENSRIRLGAQNMHWEEEGAYTGEISPIMLGEFDLDYAIIGHSERRGYFGEDDEIVNKKLKSAIAHRLSPIMCVGESLEQKEDGKTQEVVQRQIFQGLKELSTNDVKSLVVAYEPIWAIGTGKSATGQDANDVIRHIRALLGSQFGQELAKTTRILYGGSVKPANIAEFMTEPDIDGALVGGASLQAEDFAQIVQHTKSACRT